MLAARVEPANQIAVGVGGLCGDESGEVGERAVRSGLREDNRVAWTEMPEVQRLMSLGTERGAEA